MISKNTAVEHLFRPGADLDAPESRYPGFAPGRTVITAGTVVKKGAAPIEQDLALDRDVAITLRDGTTMYADVFRPAGVEGPLPALMVWSPYGKREGFITFDDFPLRAGVPQGLLSGLDKFEGPDPNWWCPRGYAVVNPDSRGAYRSEGEVFIWDDQEGRDGADVIEWIAAQDWCTGKVGMAGTSWLAIAQWFIAAERPEHLAAIAPWEGLDDAYRTVFFDGGIPDPVFITWLMRNAPSARGVEDVAAELARDPEFNDLWAAKRAAVEQIDIPAYVSMSWAGRLHCRGAFEGWHRLRGEDRWLRVNAGLEWPDFYDNTSQEDLRRFLDHFLKGEENGWRATPRVRLTVCDFDRRDIRDRAEEEFPPERTRTQAFYLDAAASTIEAKVPDAASASYAADTGEAVFDLTFTESLEVTGYAQLHLFLEAEGADDADIFVNLVKLSADGRVQKRLLIPRDESTHEAQWDTMLPVAQSVPHYSYEGPWARLRASRRGLSTDPRTKPEYPAAQPLTAGEVVELALTLSPTALVCYPGETLRLRVAGHDSAPFTPPEATPLALRNAGRHTLHTGGKYASRLVLPLV